MILFVYCLFFYMIIISTLFFGVVGTGDAGGIFTVTDEGDGWYKYYLNDSDINALIYIKCTDFEGLPQVATGLADLSSTDIFSIKYESNEIWWTTEFQLEWTTLSSTPTATGNYTCSSGSGGCVGYFENITYVKNPENDNAIGLPNGGTSTGLWTVSDPFLDDFGVKLTYEENCNATGTVGLNQATIGFGTVELIVVEGELPESQCPYTTYFEDLAGNRTDITR